MKNPCIIALLLLIALHSSRTWGQVKQEKIEFEGSTIIVPQNWYDPAYPQNMVEINQINDSVYIAYLSQHLFPMPDESNYQAKIEFWLSGNRDFIPQFLPTGDVKKDSMRLRMAREFWISRNKKKISDQIYFELNDSGFRSDIPELLQTFPVLVGDKTDARDIERYEDNVKEWIRIYSFEKYLIIEPFIKDKSN